MTLAVTDVGAQAPPTFISEDSNTAVEPGFLAVLDQPKPSIQPLPNSTGRRAALARWLTQPENPLTSRVIVNRIWQHHFGRGLAANSSDFGKLGEQPTHGELLDWLACSFVEQGWSLKQMHRLICNSATYCQSTKHPKFERFTVSDPGNRLYWRGNTRRLDAEQIRDAILSVCGELDRTAGGTGVNADEPRRTIYTRVMRNARDPLLDVFDLPQFFSSESSRNTTTTPVQSLLLINNPQMLRHASKLADRATRIATSSNDSPSDSETVQAARIRAAFWLTYGRGASEEEVKTSREFLQQQAGRISPTWSDDGTTEVATGKLPYREGQAVLLDPDGLKRLRVPHDPRFDLAEFTVETHFQLRSIYDTGSVRSLVSKWTGDSQQPGWGFGVTGKGSRRKPQTLVLQIYGKLRNGSFGEAAIFSDQHIEINKPYYAAASVRLATNEQPGSVKFFLKDLSNADEPLLIAEVPHEMMTDFANVEPVTFGGRSTDRSGYFDGLIDDVRVSNGMLDVEQLLVTAEGVLDSTVAYWEFEVEPGVYHDTSSNGLDMLPIETAANQVGPERTAFVDFCHALLNSNEFLYVD
jgi:hypothetical protein